MLWILLGIPADIVEVQLVNIAMLKVFCSSDDALDCSQTVPRTCEADPVVGEMGLFSTGPDKILPLYVQCKHLFDEC